MADIPVPSIYLGLTKNHYGSTLSGHTGSNKSIIKPDKEATSKIYLLKILP